MNRSCAFALALLMVGGLASCTDEESLATGRWTGYVTPPGMATIETTFDITHPGDSLDVRVQVEGVDEVFTAHDVVVADSGLAFWWEPIDRVACELDLHEDGVYRGMCSDAEGGVGPIVMAPPGMAPPEVSEAADARAGNEKLVRRQELDEIPGPRGEMVDVGGIELNALVEGDGPVSVILFSDVGDDLRTWDYVVDDVHDFARVMAYSRAGLGYSEKADAEISYERVASRLEMLLAAAEVPPPYVLVGHAFGAAFARAFAARHPEDIAGIVFVDPLHPAIGERLRALDAPSWTSYWNGQANLVEMMPESDRAEYELYRGALEAGSYARMAALPDVPLVVITGLLAPETPRWVGETTEGLDAKVQLHEAIANEVSQGTHVTANGSGSYVHRRNPALVVDAIRQVIEESGRMVPAG